jgi:hypothetical protein
VRALESTEGPERNWKQTWGSLEYLAKRRVPINRDRWGVVDDQLKLVYSGYQQLPIYPSNDPFIEFCRNPYLIIKLSEFPVISVRARMKLPSKRYIDAR